MQHLDMQHLATLAWSETVVVYIQSPSGRTDLSYLSPAANVKTMRGASLAFIRSSVEVLRY